MEKEWRHTPGYKKSLKRARIFKEQKNRAAEYNNRNEKYTEEINSRINEAEEWISERGRWNGGNHYHKTKKKRNEDSLRDLWDNINTPTFEL